MIYTFYSYKGGVGRTMALANAVELAARAGLNVLMVDWDLEAPGLERFFQLDKNEGLTSLPGLMDLLSDYKKKMSRSSETKDTERKESSNLKDFPFPDILPYCIELKSPNEKYEKIFLMTAGKRDAENFRDYANQVLNFDWQDFYQNWEGELFFDWLREQFFKLADIVFIDSRTGVTEIGGICTYHLSDVIVMLTTGNDQSMQGTLEMAKNFKDPELIKARQGRSIEVVVIPARVDTADSELVDNYQKEFLLLFSKIVPEQLAKNPRSLWNLRIPYVPKYSFKEIVAIREIGLASAEDLVLSYTNLIKTLLALAPHESKIAIAGKAIDRLLNPENAQLSWDANSPQNIQVRRDLIAIMRLSWIEERSLHEMVHIALNLKYISTALDRSLQSRERQSNQHGLVPPGTSIGQIFSESGRALLILGGPGSGKTYMLVQLARELLEHTTPENMEPVPVIFNLSSWASKKLPLTEWLVEQMFLQYGIGRKVTPTLLQSGQLCLLLDGLDEVEAAARDDCVKEINRFRGEIHVPLVVCSRILDYESLATQLELTTAVAIQPLSNAQIEGYLTDKRLQLYTVNKAIQNDIALEELARTPLLLSIMALAYGRLSEKELGPLLDDVEQRQHHLYQTYIRFTFSRSRYDMYSFQASKSLTYLRFLAQQLFRHDRYHFFIEDLQPDWLPVAVARRFRLVSILTFVLIFGLASGLILGLIGGFAFGIDGGIVFGLIGGLFSGLIFGLTIGVLKYHSANIIQQYLLRWQLDRVNLLPFRLHPFLDAMTDRIILQRAGPSYRFIHRTLQEHFAALTEGEIEALAREIEAAQSA